MEILIDPKESIVNLFVECINCMLHFKMYPMQIKIQVSWKNQINKKQNKNSVQKCLWKK